MKQSIKSAQPVSTFTCPPLHFSLFISLHFFFILVSISALMILTTCTARARHRCYGINKGTRYTGHYLTHRHQQTALIHLLFQLYKSKMAQVKTCNPSGLLMRSTRIPSPSPHLRVRSQARIKRDTRVNPHPVSHCVSPTRPSPTQVYKPEARELMNS